MKGWLASALAALTLALAAPAEATTATPVRSGFETTVGCPSIALTPCWKPWDATNPQPVTGTFSASFSGFQPTPAYSQLAVGATSARVALPIGAVVIIYNTGAIAASVTLGNASVVATGANDIIQPNSWVAFTVGPNVDLAAIEATGAAGTTSLVISGGSGLPTGAGGGGGGSTGGGGPLGTQAISNSQAVNPATSALWQIAASALPLPSGAATAALQPAINGDGGALAHVTNFPATQPVSAAALPLPSGAATAANQEVTAAGTSAASAQGVQGVTGGVPQAVKTGAYTSAGAGQYALSIASSTALTPPSGSLAAEICVETAAARYTDDGTTPTSSIGIPVPAGSCFQYAGLLSAFKIIGSGATIDVSYYK